MKFKLTVEMTYEVSDDDLENFYGTTDPEKAAEIDKHGFDNDLGSLVEVIQSSEFTLKVEPVK